MKHMKKIMSLCLALCMVLSAMAFMSATAQAWSARTNSVDLRVGFINDTHVNASGSGVPALNTALATLKTIGANQLDGLLFVGDIINYPTATTDPTDPTPYHMVYDSLSAAGFSKEDVLAYALGNHEFPQGNIDATVSAQSIQTYKDCTGFEQSHHVEQNGFHFIAGGGDNYNGYYPKSTRKWMMEEIDKAIAEDATNDVNGTFPEGVIPDSTKPVFVMLHRPIKGTVFNVESNNYGDEFIAFLKNRPQVINITAHMHSPAQLPDNIWQDGFTAYQPPMVGGGYIAEVDATFTDYISGYSQGSFMEIKDNVVSLYKMDYNTGEYIGNPWIVDIPAIVADRLDQDPANDKAHMLYSADKYEGANAPVFPENAKISARVEGDMAFVTYPSTAIQTISGDGSLQDDFVRGYKITAEMENGAEVQSEVYMSDFYKPADKRAESFTYPISGLNPGMKYTIKVYPMSPLKVLGAPLTTEIETEPLAIDANAVRYEWEEVCDIPAKQVKASSPAAGGKLVYSAYNSGWIVDASPIAAKDDQSALVYTFKAKVPYTCDYDVNFAINDYMGNRVSKTHVLIDGVEIGNGDGSVVTNLSQDGSYPGNDTPLALFTKGNFKMEAEKEYTVTLKVDVPEANKTNGEKLPYLFCADYIEFVPKMPILNTTSAARMEVEDYASRFSYAGTVKNSTNASKGKYTYWDTNADGDLSPAYAELPIYVEEAGLYRVEYVASAVGSNVDVLLDGTQLDTFTTTISTETKPDGAENYSYFNERYHSGNKYAFSAIFPAGSHTLRIELTKRAANGDVAICLDYFEFAHAGTKVGSDDPLKFAFFDHADKFSPETTAWKHEATYKGTLAYRTGVDVTTFSLPLTVTDHGTYEVEFVGAYSSNLSTIRFYVDNKAGTALYTINTTNTDYEDLSESNQVYQEKNGWFARRYRFPVELTKGAHTLYVVAENRNSGGVAYAWDYLSMKYQRETIAASGATRLEMEDYVPQVSIPETDGTDALARVMKGAGCSGGKYMFIDTTDGLAAESTYSIEIPVYIEKGGTYAFEYIGANGASTTDMYLDDDADTFTQGVTETVLDDQKIDGVIQYFSSTWAIAKKYAKEVTLPAGNHKFIIRLHRRSVKDFARFIDYVQFTPIKLFNTLEVEGTTAKVQASFETKVSGEVILALYNGAKLVSVGVAEVNNANTVFVSASVPAEFTNAKVFAWGSKENLSPQAAYIEIVTE